MDDLASLVAQTIAVAGSVQRYLAALPAAGWAQPSACAGWSVSHVAAHLASMGTNFGTSIERGLDGDVSPPAPAAASPEAAAAARVAQITQRATLPPTELLGEVRRGLDLLGRALERSLAANRPDTPAWHRLGLMPLSWWPGQCLVEVSLHDWDLRVAADPEATVDPAAHPGLGGQMRARMQRCFKPATPAGLDGVVRISLIDPASAWLGQLQTGQLSILDDGAAPPDATIETDPGSYALAQTSRRPAAFLAARGRWHVSGDEALARRLAAAFSGY
jgi:uncharacterized protein (TIGR03083 family)